MKANSLRVLALASLPALGAACGEQTSGPSGPQLQVSVAPLTLDNITDACYKLTVFNGPPGESGTDTVWTQANVCSTQFGDGAGAITYIGPCDAGVEGPNYVELVLNSLQANGTELTHPTDFVNPCPAPGSCVQPIECEENADVLVEFRLTIMRNAKQGFFDIIVDFEDIFCSAKFDTCYPGDPDPTPIELLHGDDPGRDWTGVAAGACTGGPGVNTQLLMTTPTVTCGDPSDPSGEVTFEIPLDPLAEGNGTVTVTVGGSEYRLGYALYFGTEQLNCGVTPADPGPSGGSPEPISCGKKYFNVAINLEDLQGQGLTDCTFAWTLTAQDADDPAFDEDGDLLDPSAVYPAVVYGPIALMQPDSSTPMCTINPVNGDNPLTGAPNDSEVRTQFFAGTSYASGSGLRCPSYGPTGCLKPNKLYF